MTTFRFRGTVKQQLVVEKIEEKVEDKTEEETEEA